MVNFKENEILAPYTTFKIGGPAKYFCAVDNLDDLKVALKFAKEKNLQIWIFGGGSNVLVSDEGFNGLAIRILIPGIKILEETQEFVKLEVSAGEVWDKVVDYTVSNNLWGIENLSHIPGRSGAFAVQNVGAYGQEASQVVERVSAFSCENFETTIFGKEDFKFAYRKSVFNTEYKNKFVILSVVLKLKKDPQPNLQYRDLKQRFGEITPTLREIREAVIEIRNTKFPFPKEAVNGNAGSFFKNVVADSNKYEKIKENIYKEFGEEGVQKLESKIFREIHTGNVKIPTAFLLDICGLKEVKVGGAAINRNQPLVIVNSTGHATAKDVLSLVSLVKETVKKRVGIELATEPEFIGF